MGMWLDWLGGVLFDASLSATVLLCLVALGLVGCRQPVRRVHLARAALVGSLALLPLAGFSPLPRIHVLRIVRSAVGTGETIAAPAADEAAVTGVTVIPGPPKRPGWAQFSRYVLPRPALILVPVYLASVAVGLGWLLLGFWGLGWLSRRAKPPSSATRSLYDALPWACRRARPALRTTERVRRPVLVGALRPTILIPAALDQPEAAEPLRLSLLHELAHAETWDPLFTMIGRLAQAFWFFLPPAWWIRAQLALDHEFLADRRAASKFGHLPSYASSLLGLASPAAGDGDGAPTKLEPAALPGSALVQRVLMLVQCPFPVESRPPAWWCWSLPGLVIAVTLASSTLRLRGSESDPIPTKLSPPATFQNRTFRLSRLTVPPKPVGPRGRAPLFELPMRLPSLFDLTVQVWGTPASLAQTRVVGLRLGTPNDLLNAFATSPSWHLVHVRRSSAGGPIVLEVDDRPMTVDTEKEALTAWLSVESPPNQPSEFQHLRLSW